MMKRASIRIRGDVQMAGFRTFTEISSLRGDLRSYMAEKFTKIEHDVEVIDKGENRDCLGCFCSGKSIIA